MTKVSIVIPVYRNEGSLKKTYNLISSIFQEELSEYLYEIIFVNDGSDDQSLQELKNLKQSCAREEIKVISFTRNFGQIAAINCGMKKTTGELAICMSADLQDPPELIVKMIESWKKGNRIVVCSRTDRADDLLSKLASAFFYRLMQLGNSRMPNGGFDYLLIDRKVINEYNKINERNRFLQGDILWLGFSVQFIPYKRLKREIGKSQWSLSKKLKYFIDGLINTSYLPIRFMSFLGVIVFSSGLIYSFLIIYLRFSNNTPFEGWAPLMIAILLLCGLIMLMLGIIGEYLWRVYDETRNRPEYIIEEEI